MGSKHQSVCPKTLYFVGADSISIGDEKGKQNVNVGRGFLYAPRINPYIGDDISRRVKDATPYRYYIPSIFIICDIIRPPKLHKNSTSLIRADTRSAPT